MMFDDENYGHLMVTDDLMIKFMILMATDDYIHGHLMVIDDENLETE